LSKTKASEGVLTVIEQQDDEGKGRTPATRVLLADDHTLFLDALCKMLTDEPDLEVVGPAYDGTELVKKAMTANADVVCIDVNMPGMNGIEATRLLLAANPNLRVVAVSASVERAHVIEMLSAGAAGYVSKGSAATELMNAIRTVLGGKTYLCPTAASVVTEMVRNAADATRNPVSLLGARERQVLQLLAVGMKPAQISSRLAISAGTVDVHRRNILRKLELSGTAELVKFAIRNGLTSAER
jgi:DNA-binding NarL/FixJ family response regulator